MKISYIKKYPNFVSVHTHTRKIRLSYNNDWRIKREKSSHSIIRVETLVEEL